jgi:hypothetical protein
MVEALIIAFVLALVCAIVIAVLVEHAKAVTARPALRPIDAASARIRAIGRPFLTLTLSYTVRLVIESGETIGHQFEKFGERLMPILADMGIEVNPPEVLEVHNTFMR